MSKIYSLSFIHFPMDQLLEQLYLSTDKSFYLNQLIQQFDLHTIRLAIMPESCQETAGFTLLEFLLYYLKQNPYDSQTQALIEAHFIFTDIESSFTNRQGLNIVHLACLYDNVGVLKKCKDSGFKLDSTVDGGTYAGDTPLHIAARAVSTQAIELLLDYNCNPNQMNQNGEVPLDVINPVSIDEFYAFGILAATTDPTDYSQNNLLRLFTPLLQSRYPSIDIDYIQQGCCYGLMLVWSKMWWEHENDPASNPRPMDHFKRIIDYMLMRSLGTDKIEAELEKDLYEFIDRVIQYQFPQYFTEGNNQIHLEKFFDVGKDKKIQVQHIESDFYSIESLEESLREHALQGSIIYFTGINEKGFRHAIGLYQTKDGCYHFYNSNNCWGEFVSNNLKDVIPFIVKGLMVDPSNIKIGYKILNTVPRYDIKESLSQKITRRHEFKMLHHKIQKKRKVHFFKSPQKIDEVVRMLSLAVGLGDLRMIKKILKKNSLTHAHIENSLHEAINSFESQKILLNYYIEHFPNRAREFIPQYWYLMNNAGKQEFLSESDTYEKYISPFKEEEPTDFLNILEGIPIDELIKIFNDTAPEVEQTLPFLG